jgi:hypothetical protein
MKSQLMNGAIELARETGWVSTISTAQKSLVKVEKTILAKLGVSTEWLKTKQAKIALGIVAPLIIGAIVWSLPMGKATKDRIIGYLKQALVLQLSQLLGDAFSSVVTTMIAITGEVGKIAIDKQAESEADSDDPDH